MIPSIGEETKFFQSDLPSPYAVMYKEDNGIYLTYTAQNPTSSPTISPSISPSLTPTPSPAPSLTPRSTVSTQPAPSAVPQILLATAKKKSDSKAVISWTKVNHASGYLIYVNFCNTKDMKYKAKLVKTVTGNKTFRWTLRSMKKNTYYKTYVIAYQDINGEKEGMAKSQCH